MTAPYKKKLIEVALTLEAINTSSARAKPFRQRHPSTLQKCEKLTLGAAPIESDFTRGLRYYRGALDTRGPYFERSAIQFNIKRLPARAEGPN